MSEEISIPVMMAAPIAEDSWLNEERFKHERYALGYAAVKTRSIPALSKITPEEAYWLFKIMKRGYDQSVAKEAKEEEEREQWY